MYFKRLSLAATVVSITGCVTVSPPDLAPVQQSLQMRATLPENVLLTTGNSTEAQQQVQTILGQPLTPASALELALLNSRALHAELAELGIAQADVVEAGLISNPKFAVGALRPEGGGRWQLDFGLSQSLLNLITRSSRKSMAQADYELTQLEVTERLSAGLLKIEATYYSAVAAAHRATILDVVAQAAEVNAQLAKQIYAAGNMSELEYLQEMAESTERRLAVEEALAESENAKLALATLLGLTGVNAFQLPEQLPDLPKEQFDSQQLVDMALAQRLDLQIVQQSGRRYEQQLAVYERSGGIEELEVGVNAEREFDGAWNYGPEFAVSLPIFHQGQAQIAGAKYQLLQRESRYQAMELAIRNDVAGALRHLQSSRSKIERLKLLVIPQRERIVQLSLQRYNFMLAGVNEALLAKQQEYEAYLEYVDSLNDYWQARSELAAAVGGGLPEPKTSPAPLPNKGLEKPMDHSGHTNH